MSCVKETEIIIWRWLFFFSCLLFPSYFLRTVNFLKAETDLTCSWLFFQSLAEPGSRHILNVVYERLPQILEEGRHRTTLCTELLLKASGLSHSRTTHGPNVRLSDPAPLCRFLPHKFLLRLWSFCIEDSYPQSLPLCVSSPKKELDNKQPLDL